MDEGVQTPHWAESASDNQSLLVEKGRRCGYPAYRNPYQHPVFFQKSSITTGHQQLVVGHSFPVYHSGIRSWPPRMTEENGEWNQVSRKRGRKRTEPRQQDQLLGIQPNRNPEFTIDEIRKCHEAVVQDWEASDCWRDLQKILLNVSSAPNRSSISKAICLGPGPFDPANGSRPIRRTAHMQTAAFSAIVANLGRASCLW